MSRAAAAVADPADRPRPAAFWSLDPPALAALLGTTPSGLTSAEARARLAAVGPNAVEDDPRREWLRLLLRQFGSPLVLILVVAAGLSLWLRAWIDSGIVLLIVLGSGLLGFSQEYRASREVASLRRRLALSARVLRDGAPVTIPAAEIVPGDVVLLAAGALIPADGAVLEADDFLVSEAGMTGESFPVEKRPGAVDAAAPLRDRTGSVFLGASVRSGTARVLVARTGRLTEFGAIALRLRARAEETDFERGLRRFGGLLVRVMAAVVLFVLVVQALLGRPAIDSLLFALALAVGLSPELLPAIVSVTLAAGARRMAARGVIVRRPESIENLGGIDVLCTDKTGTLTEGTVALREAIDPEGRPSEAVARLAHLNAALETGIDNPLDAALVAAGAAAGWSAAGVEKRDEIPYDFLRRRLTVAVVDPDDPSAHLLVTKGAFAEVLAVCVTHDAGGERPLDAPARAALDALFRERGAQGFRVLALATRRMAPKADHGPEDEAAMTLRGLLVFEDPVRAGAAATLEGLARLGIRIKVITGDNRHVAAHLGASVGLDPAALLTGGDLAATRDEALWHLAPRTDLFVEVDPQQKERIVRALRKAGHAVGYLGDGINDVPALHAADVGISVEGAVDAAREAADVVLLRRDLDVLRDGVEQGRRTFGNTLKYIGITTSANFGNMTSMALATLALPFLPLLPKQILLNNILSDLPSMALSGDRVDDGTLARPQRWDVAAVRRFMIVFGTISSAFDVLTFWLLVGPFRAGPETFRTAWFVTSLLTELAVVLVLRTRGPALAGRPSRLLLGATLGVAALALALPYLPPAAATFGLVPLPLPLVAAALGVTLAYAVATETAKRRLVARDRARDQAGQPTGWR